MRYEVATGLISLSFMERLDMGISYVEATTFRVSLTIDNSSYHGTYASVELVDIGNEAYLYWTVDVELYCGRWWDINISDGYRMELPEPISQWLGMQPIPAGVVWSKYTR